MKGKYLSSKNVGSVIAVTDPTCLKNNQISFSELIAITLKLHLIITYYPY